MIVSITPNTAVDRTLLLPNNFQPGEVSRATETIVAAGGKGLNVARAVLTLGEAVTCAGFVGGHCGRQVADLAAQEGLPAVWTTIAADTRTCIIIITPDGQDATVFNEPGPTVSPVEWDRLIGDVVREATQAECLCLCGSLPLGTPETAPADLIAAVRDTGCPIWVDTSKNALQMALAGKPSGVKVNAQEAGEILGKPIRDIDSALQAAKTMQSMGPECVVLTLGKAGAVMVTADAGWWAKPPNVEVVSSVGSGDTFLAGLVTGFVAGLDSIDALKRGVAVGTANTILPGGGAFRLQDFEMLLGAISVTEH